MKEQSKKVYRLFEKKDLFPFGIIIFIIVLVSLIIYTEGKNAEKTYAEITSDGARILTVDLSANSDYSELPVENGFGTVIAYEDNEIWIKSSSCGERICVNTGKISKPGESIVCIPARLVITVKGGGDPDAVTY